MKNAIIIIMAVVVVALGYYVYVNRQIITSGMPTPATEQQGSPAAAQPGAIVYTVVYENNKFTPATLTIKAGDTVVFLNKHTGPISIASNPHPLHTSFPALRSDIAPGFSYRFTFTEPATVGYHNHFNPSVTGQIIVK